MESLIRFDWAIKKLLRDKANFDILEGFLNAMLHEDVTVVNLLESESNKDDEVDKSNQVDLLVENTEHELILIEVQVKSEYDFFHRMAYGTSKLLTEYLEKGQPYRDIKKVISISIVYFNLGEGKDYLYYGSTNFVGVHTQDVLALTDTQQNLLAVKEVKKIFPEYYLIRVGLFPDKINEAIDEWIYMLKHSKVKPEFISKNIQHASEKLRLMNLDEEQRKKYDRYMKNVSYHESMLWSSREEGKLEGKQEGKKEGKQEGKQEGKKEERLVVARKALQQGLDMQTISSLTGLSRDEIQRIQEHE